MRRLLLTAMAGALALSACSDQSSKTPTEPKPGGPTADIASRCPSITGWQPFPIQSVQDQIKVLFPQGTLRSQAQDRAGQIKTLWSSCLATDARTRVANFVGFIIQKFQEPALLGGTSAPTKTKVQDLINTLYTGVGLPAQIGDIGSGGDIGIGNFIPGTQLLVKTTSGNAAVLIPADGFTQPTLITIIRLTDEPVPLNTAFSQFPPFYDINAANASNSHVLANGREAIVGFCAGDAVLPDAELGDPQIGHRRFDDAFEVLDPATASEYASLGLNCTIQDNQPVIITLERRGGLQGLAVRAGHAASAVLLPELLHAATVGHIGLGGRTTSLSAFGVVNVPSF